MGTYQWHQYGDVNIYEHGGAFIRQTGETTFEIIQINILQDQDDKVITNFMVVDISDSLINIGAVHSSFDYSQGAQFAWDVVNYYSFEDFGGESEIMSAADAKVWAEDIMNNRE